MSDEAKKPTLLVTVGSTLFPHLTSTILNSDILNLLSTRLSLLRVQIGKGDIPADLTDRIEPAPGSGSAREGIKGEYKGMEVDVFRYTDDFEGLVNAADLVVSHAGSGSILTALRAGKPLLVVPNTELMDNHQAQLSTELERGNYLMVSSVETLQHDLTTFIEGRGKGMESFPAQDPNRFRGIMDELMGFKEDHL